jgi:hypothetical protein
MIDSDTWPDGIGYLKEEFPEHADWLDAAQAEIETRTEGLR